MEKRQTHTIDAAGQAPGRLAVKIATLLRGKNRPDFVLYKDMGDFVEVKNVAKMKFSGKKLENEMRYTHSVYVGSLKEIPLKIFFKKNPEKVLTKAVYGMMPVNKLRDRQIIRLKFI
jgi:large subunit ribosomal protein L13